MIDGKNYFPGTHQIGVGTYTLRARAFGFRERSYRISIQENQTTSLYISLDPAIFELKSLAVSKSRFNPGNPGNFGKVDISFRVTSFGSAEITISGRQGDIVYTQTIPEFHQESQSFSWNGKISGQVLEDGIYTMMIPPMLRKR